MSLSPQETMAPGPDPGTADCLHPDDIVITGISGLFPSSDNVVQFMENLYNKVDMVQNTEPHWTLNHPEMPKHLGSIKGLERFDAQFFGVPYGQVLSMEATNRKILEHAYSAIFDAGINPVTLAGSKLSVFVASSFCDSFNKNMYESSKNSSYVVTGTSKSMLPNRISYWIDGKGPSYIVDQDSAGSMTCLEHAYWNIKKGYCDSAIVGSCNACILPVLSLNLRSAGFLCLDGKTKCFDKNGDGYVRSEAVSVLFVQKARDAKRIYAQVCAIKGGCIKPPNKPLSFTRESEYLINFMQELYTESNVSPRNVEYVEANALGIAKADGNELEAIASLFAKDTPIRVGSVKSNMGHSEGASGLCSVIKMCLANHTGKLAANLHYNEPQNYIPAVMDGRIQVLTEHAPYNRGFVALNSFSSTGINVHVLLKGHFKNKCVMRYETSIPRLILASGRTEGSLNKIFNDLKTQQIDPEKIALLHGIFDHDISNHIYRGCIIVDSNKDKGTVTLAQHSDYYPGVKNPVWFFYSGMGSQWPGMGTALMRIPVFAAAIEKCCRVLEPKGLDLIRILTNPDKTIFDNILHSFVGIAAMQMGLTHLLREIGIIPDNIIGHSVGELGCAFADGCFTEEEMMLSSFYRGLASIETELIKGSMAAVRLGYSDVCKICPPEIEVACHNSFESSTISGPTSDVKKFVTELKKNGIFAKEVNTANIAYHSRYIVDVGPIVLANMKRYIKTPKLRSKKWLSTSILPENWDKPLAKYSSAEYFTNNLVSNVYFEEVATMIPDNAIVIEISPHGLMQPIVKRSHPHCIHVPLTKRDHHDPLKYLMESIGKLYIAGLNPKIDVLYPQVQFPVSTETPILSHLVEWEHSEKWPLIACNKQNKIYTSYRNLVMSVHDDDWEYLKGHVKNDINVLPVALILVLVWETFAMYKGVDYKKLSVVFSDIKFHREVNFAIKDTLKLNIMILKGCHGFEVISEDNIIIATGFIKEKNINVNTDVEVPTTDDEMVLNINDIYSIMNLRGYRFKDGFQSIHSSNLSRNKGYIKWREDWVTFLDSLLQFKAFSRNHDGVSTLTYINEFVINTDKYNKTEQFLFGEVPCYEVRQYDGFYNNLQCAGIEIKNVIFKDSYKPEHTYDLPMYAVNHNFTSINGHLRLISTKPGDLSKLAWSERSPLENSNNIIQVHYAGPSSRDCQKAVYQYSEAFGMDFSGINKNGKRVMGVVSEGALGTAVEADPDLLWPVPDHWSMEEAATVPLPYLLAYYCLKVRADLNEKQTVLVTGGAGALGQAVISLCLFLNCTVMTSVSDDQKKIFLLQIFPLLKDENIIICNSHNICFDRTVGMDSKANQCDLVINCTSEELRQMTMKCVRNFGTFLNLNVFDAYENKAFEMNFLMGSKQNYKAIRLSSIFRPKYWEDKKRLQLMISDGIAKGIVKPLSRVVYSPADVTRAFRLLSINRNRGRVLIKMKDLDKLEAGLNIVPRITFDGNQCFVVICDENGFGIELVNRLIERGASKIVLNRQKICGYLHSKLLSWAENGVSVKLYSDSLSSDIECQKLLSESNNIATVQYIFIVKSIENDICSENNEEEECKQVTESDLVDRIDRASRKFCRNLRNFVVVTLTQKNSNEQKVIENMCQLRIENGLPTLLYNVHNNDECLWNSDTLLMNIKPQKLAATLDSLETQLKFDNTSFDLKRQTDCNFLQEIANIIGTTSIEAVNDNATLSSLSANEVIFEEINKIIQKHYQVDFGIKGLKHMTIANIKALSDKVLETREASHSGFNAIYTYIDSNECAATEPVVIMPTMVNMALKVDEDLDPTETYLLMVPGFEGHHHIFKSICERLKVKAMALQFNADFLEDSIPEMAKNLMKHIKRTIVLKSKFYILGYSFGVNIALELAALFEQEGHTGVIYCLDSSPDALKVQLNAYLGDFTDGQLQNNLLEHMYHLISGLDSPDIGKSIDNIDNWMEKVEICVQNLRGLVNYSTEYINTIIQGAYKRILLAQEYEPSVKLESELVLMKGIPKLEAKSLADDYNLSKYSTRPVQVFDIASDHAQAPHDCRVATVVNRLLSPELLQEFKRKNLCEFYYYSDV